MYLAFSSMNTLLDPAPESVQINIQIMDTTDLDKLKGYRDPGSSPN